MSSLLSFSGAKQLWKRSPKMKDVTVAPANSPDTLVNDTKNEISHGTPVTIAVVGCGQRGKVDGTICLPLITN